MKIILNPKCQSITGIIDPHHGYYILQTQKGFFTKKNKHHPPPPHTHWQLILTLAQHAYLNTHIQDIEVSQSELILALYHAKLLHLTPYLNQPTYHATDILHLFTVINNIYSKS